MKNLNAEFILGTINQGEFPKLKYPEVAFSGRSNVGKSSLLNSIVNRKNLARISSTPGKTQEINFFLVDKKWCFADLPGLGYAVVSKVIRHKWQKMIFQYFENRENLKLICVLVDSRHDPMDSDIALIEWLENHEKQFIVILTKCDKISKILVEERKKQVENLLSECKFAVEVLPYSTMSGLGRTELIAIIKRNCV
jgi:GTP-binding protein